MKETLEAIIVNLVDNKDAVEIKELEGEKSVVFEVRVARRRNGKNNRKTRENGKSNKKCYKSYCK